MDDESNNQPVVGGRSDAEWIEEAKRVCQAAVAGDLEPRLTHIDRADSLGELMHAINDVLDRIDAFVRESKASLEHASQDKFFRRVMLNGMHGSYRQAAEVINNATSNMDRKTSELAEASRERAKLVDDIAHTVEVVSSLTIASQEIGAFSSTIQSVAERTNLLALNATIEASRVGAAGRGFAVVASEVKHLARQTRESTRQIDHHVKAIRHASEETAAAVEKVRKQLALETHSSATPRAAA
jgi:methyl-accepting chemotaxis protein